MPNVYGGSIETPGVTDLRARAGARRSRPPETSGCARSQICVRACSLRLAPRGSRVLVRGPARCCVADTLVEGGERGVRPYAVRYRTVNCVRNGILLPQGLYVRGSCADHLLRSFLPHRAHAHTQARKGEVHRTQSLTLRAVHAWAIWRAPGVARDEREIETRSTLGDRALRRLELRLGLSLRGL